MKSGAKIVAESPGGVCPKYKLSWGIVWEKEGGIRREIINRTKTAFMGFNII